MCGTRQILLVTTFIMTVFTARVMADWIPDDGHKMHFPQLPDEAGWDVYSISAETVVDDWECPESGSVTDIHFWGSWKGGVDGGILGFHLSIYSDVPADPPEVPYSHPGQRLWYQEIPIEMITIIPIASPTPQGWYNPNLAVWQTDDHTDYFQYNIFLPEGMYFPQYEGEIYWLGITPYLADPRNTSWGWKSSINHWNDDGVYYESDGNYWMELHEPPFDGFYDYVPGDVDGNGIVNIDDPLYLNNWWMGIYPPPPFEVNGFYPAADANGDCAVNTGDAAYLMNYVEAGGPKPYCCDVYMSPSCAPSMDLAFVINGESGICDCLPGDANNDGQVNVGDAVYIINFVFKGGPAPTPYAICSGDANCDCEANVGDAVYIISILFYHGSPRCTCEERVSDCGWPIRK